MTRMHEILGVEPGQRFGINDADGIYMLEWTGYMYDAESGEPADGQIIADAIMNGIIRHPNYTPKQVEQLKALKVLGMGKWWLAKDGNGDVYAYKRKPKKDVMVWNYYDENGTNAYIPMTTSLVSWSDPEPLSIAQALRGVGVEE